MSNLWIISADERRKHDEQFNTLNPRDGFITGQQAREFFIKSNLPAQMLAQIWDLSDLNKDGKMDRREFSIAMHLIKLKLQGAQLPTILPESMKLEPTTVPLQNVPMPMLYNNQMNLAWLPSPAPLVQPPIMQPMIPATAMFGSTPTPAAVQPTNANVDWTMPQSSKLKYSQQFNSLDKNKTGFLSGNQARGVFGHSDLPGTTLAKIWYLSDLDKDGQLTAEEFSIASHLIDMVKYHGATLPTTLPPELAPVNWQRSGFRHQRTASFGE